MDTRVVPSSRCPDARRLLAGYIEGELAPLEARRVAAHLAVCRACRHEEAGYRLALGALSAPREPLRPGDLLPAFTARLAEQRSRQRARQPLRWATAAASLLLLAGLAGATLRHFGALPAPSDRQTANTPEARQPDRTVRDVPSTAGVPRGGDLRSAAVPDNPPGADTSPGADPERAGPGAGSTIQPDRRPVSSGSGTRRTAHRVRRAPRTRIAKRMDAGGWMERWVRDNRRRSAAADATESYGGAGPGPRAASGTDADGGYGVPVAPRRQPGAVAGPARPVPRPIFVEGPRGSVMTQLSDERVHVGSNWARVRTAKGVDRKGRPLVNVVIETAGPAEDVSRPGE